MSSASFVIKKEEKSTFLDKHSTMQSFSIMQRFKAASAGPEFILLLQSGNRCKTQSSLKDKLLKRKKMKMEWKIQRPLIFWSLYVVKNALWQQYCKLSS